jgi:hypothetical protein
MASTCRGAQARHNLRLWKAAAGCQDTPIVLKSQLYSAPCKGNTAHKTAGTPHPRAVEGQYVLEVPLHLPAQVACGLQTPRPQKLATAAAAGWLSQRQQALPDDSADDA